MKEVIAKHGPEIVTKDDLVDLSFIDARIVYNALSYGQVFCNGLVVGISKGLSTKIYASKPITGWILSN